MKHTVRMISCSLLMSSSFMAISMDTFDYNNHQSGVATLVVQSQKSKVALNLQDCIGAFEKGDWATSYKGFKKICKAGGVIGTAYMQYMEEWGLVAPTIKLGHIDIEPVSEIALSLSKEYLSASLAFREPTLEQKITKLIPLILNHNLHAVSCMYDLCMQNNGALKTLLTHKKFKNQAKKYATPIDLFKNFIPAKNPILLWNCIEPNYITYLHENRNQSSVANNFTALELQYLATNVKKTPHLLGKLAKKLATTNNPSQVKQPFFWAHFAVENGLGDLCGTLGKHYFDQLIQEPKNRASAKKAISSPTKIKLTPEAENDLALSRYYASRVQKGDLLPSKMVFSLMQSHADDYEAGAYGMLDKSKGFLFDQKAADLGCSASQFDVAVRFEQGNGITQDYGKSIDYYSLAAEQANRDALFNLGVMFQKGKGTEPNLERALYYFKCAEDLGDQEAKRIRVFMLKDLEKLKEYADQGDLEAQIKYAHGCFQLANQSMNLEEQNHYYQIARHYFKMAARQGKASAHCHLASMYYWGLGGKPDFAKARKHFKIAADLGIREAQYNNAAMALIGKGGDINLLEAGEYFSRAAGQGMIEAIIAQRDMEEQASHKEREVVASTNEEDIVKIVLPSLQEDPIDEFPINQDTESKNLATETPEEMQEVDLLTMVGTPIAETGQRAAVAGTQKEIEQSLLKQAQEIRELRAKKLAQKRAKEHSKQTITMKRKDYDKMKASGVMNTRIQNEKSSVAYETLEFVKTIFSVSTQKISAYSLQAAQQAFFDLGCDVRFKKGENSTKVKYLLKGVGTLKYKFHNPHGQGLNLYEALKPNMRRFLESIRKTPDTLVDKRG